MPQNCRSSSDHLVLSPKTSMLRLCSRNKQVYRLFFWWPFASSYGDPFQLQDLVGAEQCKWTECKHSQSDRERLANNQSVIINADRLSTLCNQSELVCTHVFTIGNSTRVVANWLYCCTGYIATLGKVSECLYNFENKLPFCSNYETIYQGISISNVWDSELWT